MKTWLVFLDRGKVLENGDFQHERKKIESQERTSRRWEEKMNRRGEKENEDLWGSLEKPRRTPRYDPCDFLYYLSTF